MFVTEQNTKSSTPTNSRPRRHPNDFDVLTGPGPEDKDDEPKEGGGWQDGMLS